MLCYKERHPLPDQVSHTLPQMYKGDWMGFWQHLQSWHGQHRVITTITNSQISCTRMSAFGLPLKTGIRMLCCKEGHPGRLGCFITFPKYTRMIVGAYDSIYNPPNAPHCVISVAKSTYKCLCIISYFRYSFRTKNMVVCYKERYPLLPKCLITSLRCIRIIDNWKSFW